MENYFEKNFELYKKKYIKAALEYEKYLGEKNSSHEVYQDKDLKGNIIYAIERDGKLKYLDSRYNSKESAAVWEREYNNVNMYSIFIVFGLANTDKIHALISGISKTCNVVIYEPSLELFNRIMHDKDMEELIKNPKVVICVKGIHNMLMTDYLSNVMTYERVNHTQILALPNYDRLFKTEMEEFLVEIDDVYKSKMILTNTAKSLGRQFNRQCFNNMFFMLNSTTINLVAKHAKEYGLDKIPAILVAGGPSLDKNVEELRNAKGKCLILCVDTAVRSLLRRDIIPDITISVDSNKPLELYEDERTRDIPFIGCMQSRYEIMKGCRAKRILYANNFFSKNFYKQYGEPVSTLSTNGSVANDAFSFLEFIGIKNIILVGQDCAFTGNRRHNSDSYHEAEFKVQDDMFYVEGYYGEPVYTNLVFNNYRKFFVNEIKKDCNLCVINATEGGALIEGAINMTLKEAIAKYCTQEVELKEFFDSLPNGVPEENIDKARAGLFRVKEDFKEISDMLKQQLENNQKLYNLLENSKGNIKEQKKLVSQISEMNAKIDGNSLIEMVYLNASVTDFEILENVYETKDDALEDLKEVSANSIKLLNAYLVEVERITETLDEVYERYK